MSLYDLLWLGWLLLFLPIELKGAVNKIHGATLSEHCWWWFCFKAYGVGRPLWRMRRFVFVLFWAALSAHFVVGLPAWPWLVSTAVPFGLTIVLSTVFEKGES